MTQTFVQSFTHLKDRPNADKALPFLQRVASLVKPIMRKHNWVLPVLSEFFPESPNLLGLNINGGQKILLRLRPAHSPDTFMDEEDVVRTMLHELTHNVQGPHDEKFYKFLSELEDDKGRRLGENISHNAPVYIARQRALEAAEKRRRLAGVVGGSRRLGGIAPKRNLSPRELAAEAAERRVKDEKACASGATAQREAEKAAKESIQDEVIDLTTDSDSEVVILDETLSSGNAVKVATQIPDAKPPVKRPHKRPSLPDSKRSRSKVRSARLTTPPPSGTATPVVSRGSPLPMNDDQWRCPRCTLVNEPRTLQCAACLLIRPEEIINSGPADFAAQSSRRVYMGEVLSLVADTLKRKVDRTHLIDFAFFVLVFLLLLSYLCSLDFGLWTLRRT
ncbi:hypothetical protein NM688_g1878 [Phlebia brevispora]|uniref:Uncharacterized protein n=1 Tax=Phlebia brevispora TaxID=194682 RepID=A0ACC1TA35_9APHY|nr:hypothetical protein NM688_g1878 [Phlebia brevispora]